MYNMYGKRQNLLPPTKQYPYKIPVRLNLMSLPKREVEEKKLPEFTPTGVRKSALRARISDRVNQAAWPYVRRLVQLKQMYKHVFSRKRLKKIDAMIQAASNTDYSKLSRSYMQFQGQMSKEEKSRRARKWTESDWKKHMEFIDYLAQPKVYEEPEPPSRGPTITLERIQRRIELMSKPAPSKTYKRVSQDEWYKHPYLIRPSALTHVTTEREKLLAKPKPKFDAD